jgi:hypothetical protein
MKVFHLFICVKIFLEEVLQKKERNDIRQIFSNLNMYQNQIKTDNNSDWIIIQYVLIPNYHTVPYKFEQ